MNPEELEGRLTTVYEKVLTTTVDNIQQLTPEEEQGFYINGERFDPNEHADAHRRLPP